MGKAILDMSMSLDGFIEGPSGDDGLHNWLFSGTIPMTAGGTTFHLTSEQSVEIFKEFVQNAGAFVIGKRSFGDIDDNPPFQLPTFVLSHTVRAPIVKEGVPITFVTDGIESALTQAKAAAGDKAVYIFGGANTAQQYIKAGLLDELQIHLVPRLFGSGLRLFDQLAINLVELEQVQVIAAPDMTYLRYSFVK